jgi:hypothetical protein
MVCHLKKVFHRTTRYLRVHLASVTALFNALPGINRSLQPKVDLYDLFYTSRRTHCELAPTVTTKRLTEKLSRRESSVTATTLPGFRRAFPVGSSEGWAAPHTSL